MNLNWTCMCVCVRGPMDKHLIIYAYTTSQTQRTIILIVMIFHRDFFIVQKSNVCNALRTRTAGTGACASIFLWLHCNCDVLVVQSNYELRKAYQIRYRMVLNEFSKMQSSTMKSMQLDIHTRTQKCMNARVQIEEICFPFERAPLNLRSDSSSNGNSIGYLNLISVCVHRTDKCTRHLILYAPASILIAYACMSFSPVWSGCVWLDQSTRRLFYCQKYFFFFKNEWSALSASSAQRNLLCFIFRKKGKETEAKKRKKNNSKIKTKTQLNYVST